MAAGRFHCSRTPQKVAGRGVGMAEDSGGGVARADAAEERPRTTAGAGTPSHVAAASRQRRAAGATQWLDKLINDLEKKDEYKNPELAASLEEGGEETSKTSTTKSSKKKT